MSLSYNRRKEEEEEAMVDSQIFFGQMKSARKYEVREKTRRCRLTERAMNGKPNDWVTRDVE